MSEPTPLAQQIHKRVNYYMARATLTKREQDHRAKRPNGLRGLTYELLYKRVKRLDGADKIGTYTTFKCRGTGNRDYRTIDLQLIARALSIPVGCLFPDDLSASLAFLEDQLNPHAFDDPEAFDDGIRLAAEVFTRFELAYATSPATAHRFASELRELAVKAEAIARDPSGAMASIRAVGASR